MIESALKYTFSGQEDMMDDRKHIKMHILKTGGHDA